jgi:hypothetical protein
MAAERGRGDSIILSLVADFAVQSSACQVCSRLTRLFRSKSDPPGWLGSRGPGSGRARREDQCTHAGTQEPQRRHNRPTAPRLAVSDQHLRAGLPTIELHQLAAAVNRALKRARTRRVGRPQLGDSRRPASCGPQSQARRSARASGSSAVSVLAHQPLDLRAERIELGRPDATPIPRRLVSTQRPPDSRPVQPRPALQFRNRDAPHEVQPAQLAHCSTLTTALDAERAPRSAPGRTPPPAPDPGHFSTGTTGSVFSRNRHPTTESRRDEQPAGELTLLCKPYPARPGLRLFQRI